MTRTQTSNNASATLLNAKLFFLFINRTFRYNGAMVFRSLVAIFCMFFSFSATASVDRFIDMAKNQSEALLALDKRIEALDHEIAGRDLLLSSQLTLNAENFNNNQDAITFARKTRDRFANLIFTQPFSTGTLFTATIGHDRALIDHFGLRQTANWEVRLTQSLWRDAFGRATSLRHSAEQQELQSRKASLVYQKQLLLIDLESVYWDYMTLRQQEKIREENLKTSRDLLKWTQQRLGRMAAEKSDLLQAQALVSGRELDLITVQNQLATLINRVQGVFPSLHLENFSEDTEALNKERPLRTLITGTLEPSQKPARWDTLSSAAAAEQADIEVKKIREQLKPQFDVYASYAQNGISDTFEDSWARAGNHRYNGARIGVNLSIPLNRKTTGHQETASRLQAEASRLTAQAQTRTGQMDWTDLERRYDVLKAQTTESKRLAQFQKEKVLEERRRYKIGRSTLFQLTTFEVDAAEAAVRQLTFLSELHKTESQARLYTTEGVQP